MDESTTNNETDSVESQDKKDTNTNVTNSYTDPVTGKFVKGNPGGGRPKGSISIKDKVRQYLEDHPDEVEAIVEHFVKKNRELMWQMLEGRPQQDVVSDGKALPTPLLNVLNNNSDKEDSGNDQKD